MTHLGAYIAGVIAFLVAGALLWTQRTCGALATPHLITIAVFAGLGVLLIGGADATKAVGVIAPYLPWTKKDV